jgi:hypothetical protein
MRYFSAFINKRATATPTKKQQPIPFMHRENLMHSCKDTGRGMMMRIITDMKTSNLYMLIYIFVFSE